MRWENSLDVVQHLLESRAALLILNIHLLSLSKVVAYRFDVLGEFNLVVSPLQLLLYSREALSFHQLVRSQSRQVHCDGTSGFDVLETDLDAVQLISM